MPIALRNVILLSLICLTHSISAKENDTDNGKVQVNLNVGGVHVTLTDLEPGTTYTFTVSAYDAAGNESEQSIPVTITTPESSKSWGGVPALESGQVDTETNLGWLYLTDESWCWSYRLERWIYAPDPGPNPPGMWVYFVR